MAKQPAGPLNDQHLKLLNKLLKACAETAAYCAKCEACDLDVDRERKANESQLDTAAKIKRTFFPNEK